MSKHILLTGANGFLGSHILRTLLAHHHTVRAIVRSQPKADQVLADHAHNPNLSTALVPNITAPSAFNEAVKSDPPFDVVIHTASPFLYRAVSNNLIDFLMPARKGTEEILKAVKANAPEVKRVVLTSSMAAVVDFAAGDNGKRYTADDWHPSTWEQAVVGDKSVGYWASKKYAERAAWDFVETEKPNFDLVTLCPPMIYGPLDHTIRGVADLNQSNSRIYDLFINSSKDSELPPNGLYLYVDVRDIANAHLQAAIVPEASNKRFIVAHGVISSQQISDILRKNITELENRTPTGKPGTSSLPANAYSTDSSPAEKVLGIKFRNAEETFVDLGKQLLAIEANRNA